MTREIKFRGQSIYNNCWIYGYLVAPSKIITYIDDYDFYHTYVKSVGQYTGLKDKNGKEIYEGDKITSTYIDIEKYITEIFTVVWSNEFGCWMLDGGYEYNNLYDYAIGQLEVIGNIYEEQK